jgi:protein-disulfide isomerase
MSNGYDNLNASVGLAGTEHAAGATAAHAASVVLVEYGDYECPYCAAAEPFTQHLVDTFGEQIKFIFRHYPLVEVHPHAELAAEAAEAAAAQGKFWEMHHLLFTHQKHLDLASLTKYAEELELDMRRFNAEMTERIYTQRVQEHRRAGEQLRLHSSPTFFINDVLVDVSFGFGHLETAVLAALKN